VQFLKIRQGLELRLVPQERAALEQIFQEIVDDYETPMENLKSAQRAFWSEPKGILEHGYEKEREYWVQHLLSLRDSRLVEVKNWLNHLRGQREAKEVFWKIHQDQIESFLQILNDRRLFLASTEAVTEEEMESNPSDLSEETRRDLVLRIHLLAALMEMAMSAWDLK
jgi:hypothetical protein